MKFARSARSDKHYSMDKRRSGAGGLKLRLMILAFFLLVLIPGLDCRMKVVNYSLESDLISSHVRVALITDLHSCRYGKGEKDLIEAIDEQAPDIILLGGDIFDDKLSNDNAEAFIRGISGRYPVYYVTGNHEYWSDEDKYRDQMEILDDCGVIRLQGQTDSIEINGNMITIAGVNDPDAFYKNEAGALDGQLEAVSADLPEDTYNILLSHRPELFETYSLLGFDLVLTGHAHGGQWRIPGLVNGVLAPNQGLFPEYAGGLYQSGVMTMIVSRGLARESTPVPRLYNRPELVIIDIE